MSKLLLSSLAAAVRQFAVKRYGVGKSVCGIGIHPPYEPITAAIVDNFLPLHAQILAANALPRDQFAKIPLVNSDAGNVVGFDGGRATSKKKAGIDDVKEAEIVIIPGLGGGDTPERLRATFSEFKRIFPKEKCLIYSPEAEGEYRAYRHTQGMLYYVNPDSILEESKNFFEKIIKPRITDKSGKLMPPESCSKLVLASFSIGCREAESHWKYFRNYLEKEGVDAGEIKKYLGSIALFNIASPRNWQLEDCRPLTVGLVSITDVGSKKPDQFLLDYLFNPEMYQRDISKIARPSLGRTSVEMLVVAGRGVVTNGGVREKGGPFISNPLGHNLANHVDAFMSSKDLSDIPEMFKSFLTSPHSEFKKIREDLFHDAVRYKKRFTPDGLEECFESLVSYREVERKAERDAPFSSRFFRKTSPESACSTAVPALVDVEINPQKAAEELFKINER